MWAQTAVCAVICRLVESSTAKRKYGLDAKRMLRTTEKMRIFLAKSCFLNGDFFLSWQLDTAPFALT